MFVRSFAVSRLFGTGAYYDTTCCIYSLKSSRAEQSVRSLDRKEEPESKQDEPLRARLEVPPCLRRVSQGEAGLHAVDLIRTHIDNLDVHHGTNVRVP